jgi:hypothetical protein
MLSGAIVYGGTKGIFCILDLGVRMEDDSKTSRSSSVLSIPNEFTSSNGSVRGSPTGGAILGIFGKFKEGIFVPDEELSS